MTWIENMDHEEGGNRKIGGLRDVDMAKDGRNSGQMKRYYRWRTKKDPRLE